MGAGAHWGAAWGPPSCGDFSWDAQGSHCPSPPPPLFPGNLDLVQVGRRGPGRGTPLGQGLVLPHQGSLGRVGSGA